MYFYIVKFDTSDIISSKIKIRFELTLQEILTEQYMNDIEPYPTTERIFLNDFRPKEAGGGIIVEGP